MLVAEYESLTKANPQAALADLAGECHMDPLGFTKLMYPDIELREFQKEALDEIGTHLRVASTRFTPYRGSWASGHGIGKTALLAMVLNWALSTMPGTRCDITAGKGEQLRTKVGPEVAKWFNRALNSSWFEVTTMSIRVKQDPMTWRADLVTWDEAQPQNYAGLHNEGRRILRIFDEASTIPDGVWESAQGSETDANTQIIMLAFSQCTKRSGWFYEATFGKQRHRWHSHSIDSRTVPGTNLQLFKEWAEDHSEDDDFFRVRVRGLAPVSGDLQFISTADIESAKRRSALVLDDDPLVLGIDVARGGDDDNVLRYRRGLDAKTIPPVVIPGAASRDSMMMVAKIADEIERRRPDAVFLDETGGSIGGPIGDRLRQLGHKVIGVQFGGESPNPHSANMRAYMWEKGREWLKRGSIDSHVKLTIDLESPGFSNDKQGRLLIESKESMKKRGASSPDHADALFLTFAAPVRARRQEVRERQPWEHSRAGGEQSWMS